MTEAPRADRSIWLLAARRDEDLLAGVVRDLAARFGTPVFQPHLTLAGDIVAGSGPAPDGFADLARGIGPIVEPAAAVDTSAAYYRSFYARFAVTAALATLRSRAHAAVGMAEPDPFLPHVSLAYGIPDGPDKEAARRLIAERLAGRPVTFDRIAWVGSAQAIPIADWAVLAEVRLG